MARQFDYPKAEARLHALLDKLYQQNREIGEAGERPTFRGLLEIMSAKVTIITAIHNIKGNHGSDAPGVGNKTMKRDYLQKSYKQVINDVQEAFEKFEPQKVRRKYINRPGEKGKRPLGIPTMRDHIVRECTRVVMEPIMRVQFFEHSYGFRPIRNTAMVLERLNFITSHTRYYWLVGGDISRYFDYIDHTTLLRRLYHMGIKNRRVLQIIKRVLEAGVLGKCEVGEEGAMQDGIISPLLADVYLDIMDKWITKQWELKHTEHTYIRDSVKRRVLKKANPAPRFLVRYADDFVIITDSREHAEFWKASLQTFPETRMKLTLSKEKALITGVRKKHVYFLGYEFRVVKKKGEHSYVTGTRPDRERLCREVGTLTDNIKKIPREASREKLVDEINRVNSQIRGVIQCYQCCTWVSVNMSRYGRKLQLTASRRLKQFKGKWIPAKETKSLPRTCQNYRQRLPSIKYRDIYIGVTSLTFCQQQEIRGKDPKGMPYTEKGRDINFGRTKKKRVQARLDELYSENASAAVLNGKWEHLNNFKFVMNRAYALNRDGSKCRVYGKWLIDSTPYTHRINPRFPLDRINRVNNLISVHRKCYRVINMPGMDVSIFGAGAQKRIRNCREKLVISRTSNN